MGQQTKSTKSKPRKRRNDGGNRVVFIIAAVLMVIYLGGRLSNAFSAAPETTPALHVTVNDSYTSEGWFFRDEEPIDNAPGSSVKHIVYSGERVQQDAPLAIIYSDQESMDLSRQLDPLEERISLLDTALQSASDSSNIAKLDQVITLTIEQLAEQVKEGSGSSVASAASSLRTLSLRREAGNVDTNEVSAERDALVSEQSSLEHQLTGRTTELTASSSGYFSEVVDGYESILTPSSLDEMTVEQFDKTVAQQPSAENSNSLGKIVKGFNWYLAAKIPAEQAERRHQTEKSVDMVAVQMRQKDGAEPQRTDTAAKQPRLRSLAAIDQKKLLMHVQCMSRGVAFEGRHSRAAAQYGDPKRHDRSRITRLWLPRPLSEPWPVRRSPSWPSARPAKRCRRGSSFRPKR